MFASAPDSIILIAFAEPGKNLQYPSSTVGIKHDLGCLEGVMFGEIDLGVDVVFD